MNTAISTQASQFSQFDSDHWKRVRAVRRKLGFVAKHPDEGLIVGHPLEGQAIRDDAGAPYTVKAVTRDWSKGFCLELLLMTPTRRHRRITVKGTTQWHQPSLAEFQKDFSRVAPQILAHC